MNDNKKTPAVTPKPLRENMSTAEARDAGYGVGMDGTMRDNWGHTAPDPSGNVMRDDRGTVRRDDKQ